MKFAMGASTLSTLTKQTSTATQDLGSLVKQLADAGAPLEGKFNGAGRAAFDNFKAHSDEIAAELNAALAAVLRGIGGMDTAFATGDSEMADGTKALDGAANYDGARFSGRA